MNHSTSLSQCFCPFKRQTPPYVSCTGIYDQGRSNYDVPAIPGAPKSQNYGYIPVGSEVNLANIHTFMLSPKELWSSPFTQRPRKRDLSKSACHSEYFTLGYFIISLSVVSSKSFMSNSQLAMSQQGCAAPSPRLMCPDTGSEHEHKNPSVSSPCHCSFHYISWWLLQEQPAGIKAQRESSLPLLKGLCL